MKTRARGLAVLLLMFALLTHLTACASGEPYVLTVSGKSVTPAGLTLTVRRTTLPGDWGFGADFTVERKMNAGWEPVPVLDPDTNYTFISIGYELFPGLWKRMSVDWAYLYGELPPGQYRIGKTAFSPKKKAEVRVWAEFEIKE